MGKIKRDGDRVASIPDWEVSPQARDFNKWTAVRPPGGDTNQVNVLKDWMGDRAGWVDNQYTAPPSFTVAPGLVSVGTNVGFSGGGGTVYWTTDGSDPRLSGGGVSGSASTGSLVNVSPTTIIRARARSGTGLTSWSGEIQGTFLVGTLANATNLLITEIQYAPANPSLAEQAWRAPQKLSHL